jgi:hypothetical protein
MISGCCAASTFSACSRLSIINLDFTNSFLTLERTGVVALTFCLASKYGHQSVGIRHTLLRLVIILLILRKFMLLRGKG